MSARLVRSAQYSMIGILPLLAVVVFYGCAEDTDPEFPRHPFVEITSGPIEGGTVSYAIRIAWEGSDPDGFIERFEYAVDPPPEFSEAEIEGEAATVTVETIEGKSGDPDVTRISRVLDGKVVSFDWVHTVDFSRYFRFATPEADSSFEEGGLKPTGRFTGMHAVYVRAMDNDGMYSNPDMVAFTSETIAPTATIRRPDIFGSIINAGPRIIVGWNGQDPDGHETDKPTGYLFKLLRLDTLTIPIPLTTSSPYMLYTKGGPWTYQAAENPGTILELETPGQYIFGVRAVDEPGAEEPFLAWGRNAFRFQAFENGGRPTLSLYCILGRFDFRGTTAGPRILELPQDTDLECTLRCNADDYGETCNEYRWGIDIPDLDLEEYWSEWSTETVLPPVQFSDGPIHVLYVEARDAVGALTLGTLVLNIVEFPLDKELLYVDDSFDDLYPGDNEHDDFWRDRIVNYGGFSPEAVGEHHAHLDNDRGALSPIEPRLEDLGRYKIVLWECRGSGYNGRTALLKATETRPILAAY